MALFIAVALPLPNRLKSVSLSYFFEANYYLPSNSTYFDPYYYPYASRKRRSIDRTTIYQALESKFESSGFPGRECLLRSICETAESPIRHNGILGDIIHVIFTPSSSTKEDDLSERFIEAELVGKNGSCSKYYPMCPVGLFDLIDLFSGPASEKNDYNKNNAGSWYLISNNQRTKVLYDKGIKRGNKIAIIIQLFSSRKK